MADTIKFLDSAGLSYLWGKIKDNFANQLKYENGELYLVDGLGQRLDDTVDARKFGAIAVSTKEALLEYAKADYRGLTVYLDTKDGDYEVGAYVVTGDSGLLRLATSTATGDINDAITALDGRIGAVEAKLTGVDFSSFATVKTVEDLAAEVSGKADASALDGYVAKVDGKGLSTNDYTTAEKEKLAGIDLSLFRTVADSYSKQEVDDAIAAVEAEAVKDSFLDDVDIVDDVIKFTWKMADGSTKTDEVDVSKYIDTYVNGEGLTLNDKTFAVDFTKVASVQSVTDLSTVVSGKADASALENYVQKDGNKVLSEVNFSQADKAKLDGIDLSLYYTSSQVDTKIGDLTTSFNGELDKKADASALDAYAKKADVYTKDEVTALIPVLQPLTEGEIDNAIK